MKRYRSGPALSVSKCILTSPLCLYLDQFQADLFKPYQLRKPLPNRISFLHRIYRVHNIRSIKQKSPESREFEYLNFL
jgi:hypothetical protein